MKAAKPAPPAKSRAFYAPILLAVVLALLFLKSFLPDYVHFSNDGPLGQQNAAWLQLPGAFSGAWGDLNEIGGNSGSSAPDVTALLRLILLPLGTEGHILYAKFFPAIALFILGLGAWAFFRQLKLSPLAATLGGVAAALNSAFFSTACWGVASQQIAIGFAYFALALGVSNTPETPRLTRWVRWALTGLCVGANVMQGADIGAIFSIFIAAFVLVKTLVEEPGPVAARLARGAGRVAVVAVFAGFIAAQTVISLVGSQITGIKETGGSAEDPVEHWNWATEWSEPKIETLGLFVPGLFGYKMDTPAHMEFFQDAYRGGVYWGAIGRDPRLDEFFANGAKGPMPLHGFMRQTGGGGYAGILVALIAAWAVAQSLRRQNSAFGDVQRRLIWFWSVLLFAALLLSFGRFGFFGGYPYRWLYELPGASMIRNPTKFILVFSWALVILFAYGVHGLSRRYLEAPAANFKSAIAQLQSWWQNARGFDRKWTWACLILFAASVLAWLAYASQKSALVKYLGIVDTPGDPQQIAAFSISQAGWFLLFFAAAIGSVILVVAGIFSGKRARLGGIVLGALLLADMGRANLPWLTYWDYAQKYDIAPSNLNDSTNPVINLLHDQPYEHRVAILPFNAAPRLPAYDDYFAGNQGVYSIEWAQHHFPYYDIQSSDVVMRPRTASDLAAYYAALQFRGTSDTLYLLARRWELCNVRYLLSTAAIELPMGNVDTLSFLNQGLDPVRQRFRIAQRFDIVPKPGVEQVRDLSELTAETNATGSCVLYEFTGALPRARLYASWRVATNDPAVLNQWLAGLKPGLFPGDYATLTNLNAVDQMTLEILTDKDFDPWQTVLLADSPAVPAPATATTNADAGTVEYTSYTPKDIRLHTQAAMPAVLLLNDKYDPNWHVTVDGKPAQLLRANFIMRGVYLPAGGHTVEFHFSLPVKPLYVTLSAIAVGVLLCGFLFVLTRNPKNPEKN